MLEKEDLRYPWMKLVTYWTHVQGDIDATAGLLANWMFDYAIKTGRTLYTIGSSSELKAKEDCDAMLEAFVKETGAVEAFRRYDLKSKDKENNNFLYVYEDGFFTYEREKDKHYLSPRALTVLNDFEWEFHTFNKEHADAYAALVRENTIASTDRKGAVHILVDGGHGMWPRDLGIGGNPIVEANYMPDVLADYKYIVRELSNPVPQGRLVLFDGPPGSGKTYLVRAILNEVDAIFLYIPSSLAGSMADAALVPVLMDLHKEGKPLIIIVEDADTVVADRKSGNTNSLSTLLNITAGILSELIDIRVVLTTNAKSEDIDRAVMRDGRLLKHVHVNELSPEQATKAYLNIVGQDVMVPAEVPTMLGEVYRSATRAQQGDKNDKTNTDSEIQKHIL